MTVISVILDGRRKGEQIEVLLSCPSPGEENTDEFPVKLALNPGHAHNQIEERRSSWAPRFSPTH